MHVQSRMKSLELSANYNIMPVRYQTLSKSALAAAVAAACVSFPALAEEDPVDLGAVTITATDISTRTERNSTYKSSAMSTTTGLALSPRETPQSVSNVTMTRIEDEGITDMSEAMRKTTGITVIQNSGTTRFLSRGFYVDQIQEDGVSSTVSGGASGNPYRDAQSLTDLAIYDHIEVVRGPTGLTQSNGEPGGTINAVRKRPTVDFQASASAEAGSWDTYRTVGDISGSLNEAQTLRGRFVGVLNKKGSFKDDVGEQSGTAYGILEADIDENTLVTFGAIYQKKSETPDYFGLPLDVNGNSLNLPKETYLGLDWTKSHYNKTNLFAELEHYFNDEWRIVAKANYLRYDSDTVLGALVGPASGCDPDHPVGKMNNHQSYDNSGWQAAGVLNVNGVYPLFGRKHDVFLTANLNREHSDSTWRRVLDSTAFDITDFTGSEIAEPDWGNDSILKNRTSYDADRTDLGLLIGTRFNLTDDWHIIAGARYAKFKSRGHTYWQIWDGKPDADGTTTSEQTTTHLTPYGGVTWDFAKSSSLYFSYTEIFKPQSDRDASGNFLDPLVGENYELGLKSEWFDRKLNTSIALFSLSQKNRAYYPDPANDKVAIALGEVVSRGVELEASGEILPGWNIFAGYTFNTSSYEHDPSKEGDTYSPYTAKHILRAYTTFNLPGPAYRWTVGAGAQVQSRTKNTINSYPYTLEQGGFVVYDASVHYKITDKIKASFIVNNIFDRRYFLNVNNRALSMNSYYGDPRNFLLRISAEY